ncbi:peptidylprolyl isomerase [Bdellovibrio sp. KM01]|uniref:FKBP-type peptidyl-prolyl cis-trans isomerase n=1 Tax=Bdellovibrio sp. KM01 TaxID=2748865 RepID=UPI0015E9944A|nr:FKBP-type peptidyl-prolyl cis-trans isomerase [Bdellovibrio sp. KM01]QLY24395.1 FKBP-type peptidyl-prolyl cis-trans isomerase [Bdellovibrio sp. KM01]
MNVQVISFNCLLKNKTGQLISSTFNREVLTSVAHTDSILMGLSKGLQNLKKGEKRTIAVSAEEAYGFYDPKKVILFPKMKLPKNLRVGQPISIVGKSGTIRNYIVLQFHDGMVSLDGNHPLAGQDLIFEIEALEARDATPEEIHESLNVVSTQLLH